MSRNQPLRPEIQGLRATAVLLVLVFHIWPSALPGGYVGVDVFFVISGYLITGLLFREAVDEGSISIVKFYSRRARRLIPAATAVLLFALFGTLIMLPESRWSEIFLQITASALYLENWTLAYLSIDYLGSESSPSPVQHYWSLSIEEQFYIFWPMIMILSIGAARRFHISLRNILFFLLFLIILLSFLASVFVTDADPAWAYFVSHTRVWELALGGALSLYAKTENTSHRVRQSISLLGIGFILWSACTFSRSTPFPGIAALAPTVGAALIIVSGNVGFGKFKLLDSDILGYIGDRSYSIYLWHWPIIVFFAPLAGKFSLSEGFMIIIATIIVSHVSYQYIEQPWRSASWLSHRRSISYAALAVTSCAALSGAFHYAIAWGGVSPAVPGDENYPGPAVLLYGAATPQDVQPIPALSQLKDDLPDVYGKGCHQNIQDSEVKFCFLGNEGGTKTAVLVGDSHAAQWAPALEYVAREKGMKLISITKSGCPISRIENRLKSGKLYISCYKWREEVLEELRRIQPDVVFIGQARNYDVDSGEMARGTRSVWGELHQIAGEIVAFEDTPWMPFDPGDCLGSEHRDCSAERSMVESPKFFSSVAKAGDTSVAVLDMTNAICFPERCTATVGNVIVWRDRHHITATYAEALGPHILRMLDEKFPDFASYDMPQSGGS